MIQINPQFSLRWLAWASLTKHMHSSVSLVQWIFPNHDINNTGQVFQACWGLNNTLWFKTATVHTKHKACLAWKQWELFSLCSWVIQKLICPPMSDIKVRFVNGQFSYSDSAKVRIFSQGRLTFSSSLLKRITVAVRIKWRLFGSKSILNCRKDQWAFWQYFNFSFITKQIHFSNFQKNLFQT